MPAEQPLQSLLLALLELILEVRLSTQKGLLCKAEWLNVTMSQLASDAEAVAVYSMLHPCLAPCRPATVLIGEIRSSGTQTLFHCSSASCDRLTRRSRPGAWVLSCPWSWEACPTSQPATGEAAAGQSAPSKTCTGPDCSLSLQQRNRAAVVRARGQRRASQDHCYAGVA